jgi:5-methyltetrahydropteroyltriglutamate--homocysteine methyltransferase
MITALLLEFDDARSGPFDPLREVPDDKMIVLGLVTTRTPRHETVAELVARVQEASRYVPLERLALSPQCGFATSIIGNKISREDQQRKLMVIAQTVQAVWGEQVVSAAGSAR